jgi:hypothetical protein
VFTYVRVGVILAFLPLGAVVPVRAAVPATVSFQGSLRNKAGQPITSPAAGTPVTFALYTAVSGGAAVWTENQSVHATLGVFPASLGSVTPLTIPFDKPYWLGIKVTGEAAEMTPRLPLQSVAYALNAWSVGGNGGTNPTTQFLGTTDDKPLVLKANGHRAVQYQESRYPGGARSVNILAGADINSIAPDVVGSVVAGGGSVNANGTGAMNDMRASFSVIGGGSGNFADTGVSFLVIGGGSGNNAQEDYSTIGGGEGNNTQGDWSTVAGGKGNYAGGSQATVAGGGDNQASGPASFVGGGTGNSASGDHASVTGGTGNLAYGSNNFIGAGNTNKAADLAAVGAGQGNQAAGLRSFIGSGFGNTTGPGYDAVVAGGQNNTAAGGDSAVGGGYQNAASGIGSVIAGGKFNEASAESATVAGGASNKATARAASVGGGDNNIAYGAGATVAGGANNTATADDSTIGGGSANWAPGLYATIPGGANNFAGGTASFAAGYNAAANHTGSFVWSDYSSAQLFSSQANNQFAIRAAGGLLLETGHDATIITGTGTSELNRYLSLYNSSGRPSASGLKAGGILCADDFGYFSPGKNDMVVKGRVSVGYNFVPQNYTMSVNGSIYALNGYSSSDARYKRNVRPLDSALASVLQLRGVSFEWDRENHPDHNFPQGRQLGVIAQEVETALPEVVSTDDDGYKSVSYQSIVPVLVEAVKTLEQRNADLAARNDDLAARVEALGEAVRRLQAEHK